jgi:methylase of polypeptide subunit release factors
MNYKERVTYRGKRTITVQYVKELDGGGLRFGQQFNQAVALTTGPVRNVFELCSGPGFIGFSLLSRGLCDRLTLADINLQAIEACRSTINANSLTHCCVAYQSDVLEAIPQHESWDLVVGNPPHWPKGDVTSPYALLRVDLGLSVHKRFFAAVAKHLRPNGSILLQENSEATSPDDFSDMISVSGYIVRQVFYVSPISGFYFIWCTRKCPIAS